MLISFKVTIAASIYKINWGLGRICNLCIFLHNLLINLFQKIWKNMLTAFGGYKRQFSATLYLIHHHITKISQIVFGSNITG